jgi:acyl transferase domain-containing protein
LAALAVGEPHPLVVTGSVRVGGDRPVFVFAGQGSQWPGMAVELLAAEPVFAERMAVCAEALAPFVDWSLRDALSDAVLLARVDVVQPVLWAVMVSLAELWRSVGVCPAAVVGHSQGEIAAAVVAGALSLEDGARVVAVRSRALRALSGTGGMLSVNAPVEALELGPGLWVAVVNGPDSCVVAGEVAALEAFAAGCPHRTRLLPVDYASHTPHVEALEATLHAELAGVTPTAGDVQIYSCVTGGLIDGTALDAGYWYTNLRQPVRFADTVQALAGHGLRVFVEPSPHPALTSAIASCVEGLQAVGTLRRDDGGVGRWHTSLAEAWTIGIPVDWHQVIPAGTPIDLPTYPFQHQRYWIDTPAARADPADAAFWGAVDGGDLPGLAERIGVDSTLLAAVGPALAEWRKRRDAGAAVDRRRYRVEWHPATLGAAPTGRWLAIVPTITDDWVDRCLATLAEAGADVVRVEVADRTGLTDALQNGIDGIVSLLGADDRDAAGAPHVPAAVLATVTLLQVLDDLGVDAPLWTVTRDPATPVAAQLWALGRVAALEYPRWWGGLVGAEDPDGPWPRVLGGPEDQVVIRDGAATARRLVHAPHGGRAAARQWRPHGTVLVTGGTGALGAHVGRWLAGAGAAHVVLASRSGPEAPGAAALAAELAAFGARVTVAACDIADRAAVADLISKLTASGDTITAVFHTAGVLHVESLAEVTTQDWIDAYAAKVGGAVHLEGLLDPQALEAFVLFSSNAGIWGSGGQSAYAAANAALDAIAERRRAQGLPATSVAWGAWAGDGMATRDTAEEYLRRRGVLPMRPERAIGALHDALDHDETTLVVADVDWERFTLSFTSARPSPLLGALPECQEALRAAAERETADPGGTDAGAALVERLGALPRRERANVLTELVRRHAAAVLGHASLDALPAARPFKELGFDSLTAVELRDRLTGATGRRLPASVVYDHPTATALARYLLGELVPDGAAGGGRVLAELERLAAALDGVEAGEIDEGQRMRVTMRLRTLLTRWEHGGPERPAGTTGDELEAATDDEIFSLVDNVLGIG